MAGKCEIFLHEYTTSRRQELVVFLLNYMDKWEESMEKNRIRALQERIGKVPCWLVAFMVNLVIAMLAICPFLLRDNGYIAMSHDFSAEEIAFNIFMNDTVKSGNLLWNWGIDLGGNFLESFSFYNIGSVFVWISLLFPSELIPKVMGWMIILKWAVAGATSAGYMQRHTKNKVLVIIGSILYAFSGYQCCSVVFYHFHDVVALFPLMLTGLEVLIEDKKKGRLIAACVLNVFCNYIFYIGEVMFLVMYYVVKYMVPDIKAKKKGFSKYAAPIGSCMIEGAIGTALGGILLIPSVYGTMSNTRLTNHIAGRDWLGVSTQEWMMLIKAFFTPAEAMNDYSSVNQANWSTNAAYLPVFGLFFVIAYVLYKKDWISNLLKVCMVFVAVPLLNSMFMTFMPGGYRRWYYMMILVMVLATIKVLESPQQYPLKKAGVIWCAIFAVYIIMTSIVDWDGNGSHIVYNEKRYYVGIAIAILGFVLTAIAVRWLGKYRNIALCLAVAVFAAGTLGMNIHHYQTTTDNSTLNFKTYPNSYAENVANYLTEIPSALDRDVEPYRYYFDEGIGYSYYNFAMMNSLPSINSFISTAHSSIAEFYEQLEVGRATWTNAFTYGTRELLSARYVVSLIEQPEYTYIDTLENSNGQVMHLYENEDALPIGFTYDMYLTRSEFENVEKELRPVVMLSTLVVEDEDAELVDACMEHYDYGRDGEISLDDLDTTIEERRQESSEEFTRGDNTFTSIITADSEKYAFFSVPYDKCWKATVNGVDTEVLNINGLMAVRVDKGTNEIEFNYEYWPLKAGVACSVFGVVLLAGYLVVCKHSKKK